MSIVACPHCTRQLQSPPHLAGHVVSCPHCGQPIQLAGFASPPMPPPVALNPFAVTTSGSSAYGRRARPRPQDNHVALILGIVGSVLMLVGFFCPVMKVPIVGGFSYMTMVSKQAEGFTFNDLGILGLAVAGFAVFGFVVSLIRLHYLNFIPAGIGIIAVAATMMKFWSIKSEMTANMKRDLEGNPFAGIGTIMTEAFQLDFGIGVIAVAAMLLIGAGACGVLMNPTR